MEKELKVRKKRFLSFWTAVALICSFVVPMIVSAGSYAVSDALKGETLQPAEVLSYAYEDMEGTTYAIDVNYYDYDDQTVFDTLSATGVTEHSVQQYPKKLTDAEFAGWYVRGVYGSGDVVSSVDLCARLAYSIAYDLDDGTNHPNNPGSYVGGLGTALADAEKTGHTFEGWYQEPTFETKVEAIDVNQTGAVHLYAKFTAKTYSISYESNGGVHENTVAEYTYGVGVDNFADAVKEGYTFEGWYSDAAFTEKVESVSATTDGDITLHAKFTQSITYELNGGTNAEGNPVSYVEGIGTSLADAVKPGYAFAGWYDAENNLLTAIGADQTGDITLTASWTADTYNIIYNLDGGTNGENPVTYTNGTTITLENAAKDGYTFAGWYSDAAFTTAVTTISTPQISDIVLYAKFEYVPAVIETGTHELVSGVQYILGNVTQVAGDSSTYIPGSTFYVSVEGSYTFS